MYTTWYSSLFWQIAWCPSSFSQWKQSGDIPFNGMPAMHSVRWAIKYIWFIETQISVAMVFSSYIIIMKASAKENRIYIRGEFIRKKCKTAILLYCFHTAGVHHIFVLYNFLGPDTSFYRKSKINIKRKPNYYIGWFHNWPMIISHRLYDFQFTNDDLPL